MWKYNCVRRCTWVWNLVSLLREIHRLRILENRMLRKIPVPKRYEVQQNSTNPDAGYPDRLGPFGKFAENSTKLTCLEITGYRINYSAVLWLTELQIWRGRKVQTQVHTVNCKSRTANCQCSLLWKKNPIIRIFCISGWLTVPINPDMWGSTATETGENCIMRRFMICTPHQVSLQWTNEEGWLNGQGI